MPCAGLGDGFSEGLCEAILFRPVPLAGGGEKDSAQGARVGGQEWQEEKEILLKYVNVLAKVRDVAQTAVCCS
jgi:hypothetical protein